MIKTFFLLPSSFFLRPSVRQSGVDRFFLYFCGCAAAPRSVFTCTLVCTSLFLLRGQAYLYMGPYLLDVFGWRSTDGSLFIGPYLLFEFCRVAVRAITAGDLFFITPSRLTYGTLLACGCTHSHIKNARTGKPSFCGLCANDLVLFRAYLFILFARTVAHQKPRIRKTCQNFGHYAHF